MITNLGSEKKKEYSTTHALIDLQDKIPSVLERKDLLLGSTRTNSGAAILHPVHK